MARGATDAAPVQGGAAGGRPELQPCTVRDEATAIRALSGRGDVGVAFTMSFTHTEFGALRPFLFHLTAAANLPRILRTRRLECAAHLAQRAWWTDLLEARRRVHLTLTLGDETVWLRDHAPRPLGNVALELGWPFAQFVAHLDACVFL